MKRLALTVAVCALGTGCLDFAGARRQYCLNHDAGADCDGGTSPAPADGGGHPTCVPAPHSVNFAAPNSGLASTNLALLRTSFGGAPAFATAGLVGGVGPQVEVRLATVGGGQLAVGPALQFTDDGGLGSGAVGDFGGHGLGLVLAGDALTLFDLTASPPQWVQRVTSSTNIGLAVGFDVLGGGHDDLLGITSCCTGTEIHRQVDGGLLAAGPFPQHISWANDTWSLTRADLAGDGNLRLVQLGTAPPLPDGGTRPVDLRVVSRGGWTQPAQYTAPVGGYMENSSGHNYLSHFTQDIDGDGREDVVVISTGIGFSVLYGQADGGLGRAWGRALETPDAGLDVTGVGFGDLDGDCLPDALVAGYRTLWLLPGLADGGFGDPAQLNLQYLGTRLEGQIHLLDLNGDGRLDVLFNDSPTVSLDYVLGTAMQL